MGALYSYLSKAFGLECLNYLYIRWSGQVPELYSIILVLIKVNLGVFCYLDWCVWRLVGVVADRVDCSMQFAWYGYGEPRTVDGSCGSLDNEYFVWLE